MKKMLNVVTNNNPGILKMPVLLECLQSVFKGQPYFVILFIMLELLKPLENPGTGIDYTQLIILTVWLAISMILLFVVGKLFYNVVNKIAYGSVTEGRLSLGEHLRKLSMGFFRGRDPGDITALMLHDYTNIETMVSRLLMDVVGAIIFPVIFACFLFFYDWRMTLITLIPVPIAILAAVVSRMIVLWTGKKHIKAKNLAASVMLEYLEGIKNIKAFNLWGKKFSRLETVFLNLKKISIKQEAFIGPSMLSGIWILNAGIALIMLTGAYFVMEGTLSIIYFLFFLIIGTRMYDPLCKALTSFVELTYYSISANRIKEVFNIKPLPEPAVSEKLTQHNIEFKNVWFRYHKTDVLKDVSFSLPENTMTALVGPSGSGKSTITRLIARFWDIDQGEIMVGGRSVKKMKNSDLLANISMVFQDVYLFNGTILNNIKIGKADASEEEVFAAAKKARCHEFVEKLPEGYETLVGEGGATLSGGEKQRISIARAILKDAPIILLDEATASLDPENELYIQEALGELVKSRTLIVIAHRLSTITHANQILVLKEGKITGRGTHQELLTKDGGLYQSMWNEQRRAHGWKIKSKEVDTADNKLISA